MAKVITVKVNKGGIGKTFISTQLGHGLSKLNKKVLLLTSDSQNNILDYTFGVNNHPEFSKGFINFVNKGEADLVRLRENLFFIPLESSVFSNQFLQKLPAVLEKLKEEYDYIIIDSIPTMKIDATFVELSDHVIVPCYCDGVTINSILNVIEEAGVDKIHTIVVNRFKKTAGQKKFFNYLKEQLEGTGILFPEPIPESSQIEKLLGKGKTVFESNTKTIQKIQDSIFEILAEI
jgi:chromosome partitioning protein